MVTKFIPILFSTEMVQAILEGRKTMTRRIVKPQPDDSGLHNDSLFPRGLDSKLSGWNGTVEETGEYKEFTSKYGKPGDVLWVRETSRKVSHYGFPDALTEYKAGGNNADSYIIDEDQFIPMTNWKSSIHMPKTACRIFLRVKNVRVERLQDIKEEDAKQEGVLLINHPDAGVIYKNYLQEDKAYFFSANKSFYTLWDFVNGKGAWYKNPWVWVVEFERIDQPSSFLPHA